MPSAAAAARDARGRRRADRRRRGRSSSDIPRQPEWMRDMKRVDIDTPGPVGVGTTGARRPSGSSASRSAIRSRSRRSTRRRDSRSGTTGCSPASGVITLEPGADGTTTIVRWEERLVPPLLPELGAVVQAPILRAVFQDDLRPPQAPGRDRLGAPEPLRSRSRWKSTSSTRRTSCSVPTSRPGRPSLGQDGVVLSGVSGPRRAAAVTSSASRAATHVGCATDRVIRSFRNELYAGYKTEAGHAARAARASSRSPSRRSRRSG